MEEIHAFFEHRVKFNEQLSLEQTIPIPRNSRLLDILYIDIDEFAFIFEIDNIGANVPFKFRIFKPFENIPKNYYPLGYKVVMMSTIAYICVNTHNWSPLTRRVRDAEAPDALDYPEWDHLVKSVPSSKHC